MSQRTAAATPAIRRVRLSLRHRLLLGTLALLAALSATVGIASVAIVHNSLVGQIDAQLQTAIDRGQGGFDTDRDHADGRPAQNVDLALRVPGQSVGMIGAVRSGDQIAAAIITADGSVAALPTAQRGALAQVSALQTITIPGLGNYRALAESGPLNSSVIIAIPLAAAESTTAQLAWSVALVALIALAIAAWAGSWMIRRSLRPLAEVTQTARAVSELDLARGEVALHARVPEDDERTEVGQLGAAFNRMLGHMSSAFAARESSEQKVRQFVADASHELRTPLASIRGYAELTRMSPESLPADAQHALGRIEAESVRMTSLVEDLLLLARLDEGRELHRQPVNIVTLLMDSVADARAAAPGQHISFTPPENAVVVHADEARLRQVVVNLLSNARVHTPEGSHILVELAVGDTHIACSVRDDGPGIDPAVRDSLFERFARADSSRSRAAGSTGLGLAIAAAVVRAHDGELTVQSEPGNTVFTVSLPRADSVD